MGVPWLQLIDGIGWHSLLRSRKSRHTDFVSSGFLFLFFSSYGDVGEQVLCNGCSIFQV